MRLAVTGASGFCGAAVARTAASRGARVYCLGRRPGPVGVHRPWDATREHPDLSGVDAVIHLAAAVGDPGPRDEARYHAVNVDGTRRLLEAAVGRPVVWVSSASVYRLPIGPEPITEDHPTDSHRNAYGRTKAAGSGWRWTPARWCCGHGRSTGRVTRTCCRGCGGWPAAGWRSCPVRTCR